MLLPILIRSALDADRKRAFSFFKNSVICFGSGGRAPCRRYAAIDPVQGVAIWPVSAELKGFAHGIKLLLSYGARIG